MATFNNGDSGSSVRTKINAVLQHADGTAGELVINDAGADVDFRVESDTVANALFVDGATGNVSIGTNNPAGKKFVVSDAGAMGLEVSPNDSAQGYTRVLNYNRTSNQYAALRFEALTHRFYTGTGGTVLGAEIDSTGNVGIGISPRSVALDIYRNGSNASEMRISNDNDGTLQLYTASGTSVVGTVGATPLVFRTFAQERMRINATGNVGIGVTPAAWNSDPKVLQLYRGVALWGTSTWSQAIFSANMVYGASSNTYLGNDFASQYEQATGAHRWYTAPAGTAGNTVTFTQAMTLDASGNLLVGRTTVPVQNTAGAAIKPNGNIIAESEQAQGGLWVNRITSDGTAIYFTRQNVNVGSISVTGSATTYSTSSDYRLKEDIQPVADATERLMELKPVNFAWKSDSSRTDGFIAHEVQAVVPQAVTGEKDGDDMQQMDHSKLVPLLTAALQKAIQQIELLEARLDAANL